MKDLNNFECEFVSGGMVCKPRPLYYVNLVIEKISGKKNPAIEKFEEKEKSECEEIMRKCPQCI